MGKMNNMHDKLLKIQQEIGTIKKDATNPFFKSKYFDINTLLADVKPILNKYGVVLLQGLTNVEGRPAIKTELMFGDNEILDGGTITLPDIQDPQKMGSGFTYYRRYAIQSLLALEAEDDDANSASDKTPITKRDDDPLKTKKSRL